MTPTTLTDVRIILRALTADADKIAEETIIGGEYHEGRGDAYRTALALLEEVAS